MNNFRESKEEIMNRMIRTALDYWNIKKVENLDPFIRLLIEALSMQLHYLSDDISDIEVRAMKRLSEVLLPEVVTVVRPAHAIVHVNPTATGISTSLFDGFSAVSPFAGRKSDQKFSFYPVCNTPLRKGNVKKIIVEGDVYEVLPDQNKQLLLKNNTIPENVNRLFVGVDLDEKTCDLQNLSFYFDFPNMDGRNNYLHQLSSCSWKFQGERIQTTRGLYKTITKEEKNLPNFFRETKNDCSVDETIVDFYKENYITIRQSLPVKETNYTKYPEEYLSYGYEVDEQLFTTDLLWFEVNFPAQFSSSILSDIQISINTFPVANKELHLNTSMVKKEFGVIPLTLSNDEFFFDVVEVTDDAGRNYRNSYGYKENPADLYFSLRKGGCESFDQRSAKEYLTRLQSLLQDELSAFTSSDIGNNSESIYLIENLLHKMDMVSNRSADKREEPYYIFLEPQQKASYFYVKYWTSYGPMANGMRIGMALNITADLYGNYEEPILLTSTVGGSEPLSEQARIAKFKYILSSRNRIVTNSDIRNFCFSEMPDSIKDVVIEKGIWKGNDEGNGLLRTIDVHLIMLNKNILDKQKTEIQNDIYGQLKALSPMTYNYRIFID